MPFAVSRPMRHISRLAEVKREMLRSKTNFEEVRGSAWSAGKCEEVCGSTMKCMEVRLSAWKCKEERGSVRKYKEAREKDEE